MESGFDAPVKSGVIHGFFGFPQDSVDPLTLLGIGHTMPPLPSGAVLFRLYCTQGERPDP